MDKKKENERTTESQSLTITYYIKYYLQNEQRLKLFLQIG